MPKWRVGASRDLQIEYRDQWRGDESSKRVLDAARIGGDNPDNALAQNGFLIYDAENPDDRGSYKDCFTDVFDGKIKCVSRAIEILPGFIGKTDVPQNIKDEAMRVVDHYKQQIEKHNKDSQARKTRRQRLPTITALALDEKHDWHIDQSSLDKWDGSLRALYDGNAVQIDVFGPIGKDPDTGRGISEADMVDALREAAGRPVALNINSPGGSYSQGVSIYSALKEYPGEVTANVIGQAASAASVVAMAADKVRIAQAGCIMIHNAWTLAMGDKRVMGQVGELLDQTDKAMASVYSAATGKSEADICNMMDAETYLFGNAAVAAGFADEVIPASQIKQDQAAKAAARADRALYQIDAALAGSGITRARRRELIAQIAGGTPRAASEATPRAGLTEVAEDLRSLLTNFH